jgi:hypothetical protein
MDCSHFHQNDCLFFISQDWSFKHLPYRLVERPIHPYTRRMSKAEFETLALDLLEATVNIASVHKVDEARLIEEFRKHSQNFNKGEEITEYANHAACIAYAFHQGIQSAVQAWSVLRKGPIKNKVGNITILGGGCCFELPVLLHFLKDQNKEISVKVIDPIAKWKIFQPMHVRMAERMGIRLHLDYVPVIDILEQIDSYKTDLLVTFNSLNELSFGERKALRTAYATCNRHLIWHSSLTVMQDVFSASYVPSRNEINFEAQAELSTMLAHHYPKFAKLNPFANLGKKGFYLMHNLAQVQTENAFKWASKF